jgi:predicted nucleic acid-binding protein
MAESNRRSTPGFASISSNDGRIVDITAPVVDLWGELMADSKQRGIALHAMDGFLAATARAHNQTLVTRNVKDFAPFGLPLLNPWDGG